ncbi:MAG TPA: tetratricopeptide repeat protein [Candidatus Limnocylindrales bacterium]|jgi:tetratricopeptide (TPR) repeat protein
MTGSGRPDREAAEPSARAGRRAGPIAPRSGAAAATSLYERYKDALRRGHVAALRGRHDAAIDAYGEAASIAPDRALPHASIGGILAKMNRPADAIAAYRRALDLAPRDETALRGIAETQMRLGRRAEAASALDRLAEGLEAAGRLPDATETARRALELAESRPRRDHLEALVARLQEASAGDGSVAPVLASARGVLEATAPLADTTPAAEPKANVAEVATESEAGVTETAEPEIEPLAAQPAPGETALEPAEAAEPEVAGPETPELETPEPEIVEPAGLGIALGAAAEAHLYAGELGEAHEGLLAAARSHRRAGRLIAAVDACDLAISIAPDDPDLHLLLAELYLDRGWRSLAAEKLLLLGRIARLDDDAATRERLCAIAAERLPDDGRLTELCA